MNALLIGNSVNRLVSHGPSWKTLIDDLATTLNVATSRDDLEDKPFPLFFDYLTLQGRVLGYARSKAIKEIVAKEIARLEPGTYHRRLMGLGLRHVLTTNYDLALERATPHSPIAPRDEVSPKYNLFRRRDVGETTVWHIHGIVDAPRSIVLGYDHYAGSLERMRGYLKREYNGRRSPFYHRISDFETQEHSWLDVFLRDDVHIVGLGMDYPEIDLWWIINYKASRRSRGKEAGNTHFYHFVVRDPSPLEKARHDLLAALGVYLHPVRVETTYESAWDRLLDELEARLRG